MSRQSDENVALKFELFDVRDILKLKMAEIQALEDDLRDARNQIMMLTTQTDPALLGTAIRPVCAKPGPSRR